MEPRLHQITYSFGLLGRHLLTSYKLSRTTKMKLCPTHIFCNRQARQILEGDGYTVASNLVYLFKREMDLGVCWPDSGWGCAQHFYHARYGNGLPGVTAADELSGRYYKRALDLWQQGCYSKAMFFLGAATHLLQDICQPFHASCCCGIGHYLYEKWVQENVSYYEVNHGGIYIQYREPVKWLENCAGTSCELFDLVNEKSNFKHYHQATEYLLPLAQRVTAGFWLNFFRQAGIPALDLGLDSLSPAEKFTPVENFAL